MQKTTIFYSFLNFSQAAVATAGYSWTRSIELVELYRTMYNTHMVLEAHKKFYWIYAKNHDFLQFFALFSGYSCDRGLFLDSFDRARRALSNGLWHLSRSRSTLE